jgi:hypothetical protein
MHHVKSRCSATQPAGAIQQRSQDAACLHHLGMGVSTNAGLTAGTGAGAGERGAGGARGCCFHKKRRFEPLQKHPTTRPRYETGVRGATVPHGACHSASIASSLQAIHGCFNGASVSVVGLSVVAPQVQGQVHCVIDGVWKLRRPELKPGACRRYSAAAKACKLELPAPMGFVLPIGLRPKKSQKVSCEFWLTH